MAPLLLVLAVVAVFWKLVLTKQYTFLDSPDPAYQVMPWLQVQVASLRQGSILLWDPYLWFGQPLLGQVQPAVVSPFTWLLALAPLRNGQIQMFYVHLWFVLIHCAAALFAYLLFRDLGCTRGPSVLGGLFYATAGFCGSTEWPQILAAAIWAPLVFLFLLRSLRGRSPIKDAAWAGVALGFSWLSGHHGPSLILTLAAVGVMAAYVLARRHHPRGILHLGTMLLTLALVSALQVLPAIEYGRQAVRWTGTGLLRWQDKVQFPEHASAGLRAVDLLYLLMPEGVFYSDPFVGTVGASLAAFAVVAGLRRVEVRLFVLLGLAALFYAMAGHGVLYGPLYALCPLVEKSRSPIVALSVFHFSVAALAAIGAHLLLSRPDPVCLGRIPAVLAWFGGITFGIFAVLLYLRPTVSSTLAEADPRPATIALVALLLAWLYRSWGRGLVRRESMLAFLCLLLIVEQGNKVGWVWSHVRDSGRMTFIGPLYQTQDLAAFLRSRSGPIRVEVNPKDLAFNFGDWYGLETTGGYLPSILEQSHRLNWWQDRLLQMYGVNYTVSRASNRAGQQDLFTSRSGIKVFANPAAFPRAWTVHHLLTAPDEDRGAGLVRDGAFDLRDTAVLAGAAPSLDRCESPDRVTWIDRRPSTVALRAQMGCKGMLVVGDNWYPGWHAQVDGRTVPIWRVNTVIRGVILEKGSHQIVMRYRPASVYVGLICWALGLAVAVCLQCRREAPELDLMKQPRSTP